MKNTIENLTQLNKHVDTIKYVIFDCFGTLMEIKNKTKPYKKLLYAINDLLDKKIQKEEHQKFMNSYARWVMSEKLSLEQINEHLQSQYKVDLSSEIIKRFQQDIEIEINSIQLYPETIDTLWYLKNQDIKISLCSNLALPYGNPAKEKLLSLDHYFLSYELNLIKPDLELFSLCHKKIANKEDKSNFLFVGDNIKDDYEASQLYGFNSILIKRNKEKS